MGARGAFGWAKEPKEDMRLDPDRPKRLHVSITGFCRRAFWGRFREKPFGPQQAQQKTVELSNARRKVVLEVRSPREDAVARMMHEL